MYFFFFPEVYKLISSVEKKKKKSNKLKILCPDAALRRVTQKYLYSLIESDFFKWK